MAVLRGGIVALITLVLLRSAILSGSLSILGPAAPGRGAISPVTLSTAGVPPGTGPGATARVRRRTTRTRGVLSAARVTGAHCFHCTIQPHHALDGITDVRLEAGEVQEVAVVLERDP